MGKFSKETRQEVIIYRFIKLLTLVGKMDNGRKKFVNVRKLSSGGIYAVLESFERDDEGEFENLMNY